MHSAGKDSAFRFVDGSGDRMIFRVFWYCFRLCMIFMWYSAVVGILNFLRCDVIVCDVSVGVVPDQHVVVPDCYNGFAVWDAFRAFDIGPTAVLLASVETRVAFLVAVRVDHTVGMFSP